MTQENVELVRGLFEAVNRGDGATVLDLYDPDVELEPRGPLGQLIGGGVYRGHDGIRSFYRAYYDAWEHVEYEIEDLIDVGEQVVSIVTNRGRGRTVNVPLDWSVPGVWTIKDGKIVRVVFFASRDEALEAVGLRE